jgi:hypothetical protein
LAGVVNCSYEGEGGGCNTGHEGLAGGVTQLI